METEEDEETGVRPGGERRGKANGVEEQEELYSKEEEGEKVEEIIRRKSSNNSTRWEEREG